MGIGAHMSELRRVKVGNFTEAQAHSLLNINDAYQFWKEGNEKYLREILIPVEYAIDHVKKIFVKDSAVDAIAYGSPIYANGISRIQEGIIRGETIAIFTLKSELVALGIAKMSSEEMDNKSKGLAARTDRVFMGRDVYPSWK
jgi:H/ACA ribonucleoprotein complex subunit 4